MIYTEDIYKTKRADLSDLNILVALSYNMTKEERYEKDDFKHLIKNDKVEILYLNDIPIGYYVIITVARGKELETILLDRKYQGTEAINKLCDEAISPKNGNPLWTRTNHRRTDMICRKYGFEIVEKEIFKGIEYTWWINRFQSQ